MKSVATAGFILLVIFLSALYLPMLYGAIFFDDVEKTHLFYSPVEKTFVLKEKVVGKIPEAVRAKAEDHHAGIAYQKASGTYISRVEFETLLPFIYYKNMEIWGLLPLKLSGQSFTKKDIKAHRRVLELKSAYITGNSPQTPVWPLLESNPGQARLVFPDDRFRMTDSAMEFINADENRTDPELTQRFTAALKDAGFVFPARSVNGKFTVLKPFDEGVFIVDAEYRVFHLKRVNNAPLVVRTPIDASIKTRHIEVSESRKKGYYGLLLDHSDRIWLLCYDQYRLVPVPLHGYEPDRMDFKLIFNPLYITAIYSDYRRIHAIAMDRQFNLLDTFTHIMSRASVTRADAVYAMLFPFDIRLDTDSSGFFKFSFHLSGWRSLVGILACLGFFFVRLRLKGKKRINILPVILVLITGIYGLAAVEFTGLDE